jgi:uncharacterized protein YjbI with pentapeptide repeats
MAKDEHLSLLKQGVDAWNEWRRRRPSVFPDFSGADLNGANLTKANLREADLETTKLRGANLSGANLSDTLLRRTDLYGANLTGAKLSEAILDRANLTRANLRGVKFRETDLRGADLTQANLIEVNFREAYLDGANLTDANLSGTILSEAYLGGTDFTRANLTGANLREANLTRANLSGANLSGTNLRKANLTGANLSGANLSGANLSGTSVSGANLSEAILDRANLTRAELQLANLIDARLDGANLTGVRLWETQRGGWSIKGVSCRLAFWDRTSDKPTNYVEGEFERIFAEKPRIVLHYPGGMSPVDLLALPLIVERLQTEHPGSVLQVRSMQNDAGGASVTITVEDLSARAPEEFGQELVRIQTKLECVIEERDRIQRLLGSMVSEGISRMADVLKLPRQEIHVHRPSGLTAIEGPVMSGDTYNISGQAGAVGPGAHAQDNTFQQIQSGIDLPKLAEQLGRLRDTMKGEATGTREQDKAIGAVADAEEAAVKGDGPAALRYLKGAGTWALGIAEKIGVNIATEALKKAM